MGRILLVRHAQASFGADDYDCLSEHGLAQAARLGQWFTRCARKLDVAVTGAMRRHAQTAEAALGAMAPELRPREAAIVDAGFDEYDAGHVVQCAWPELSEPAASARLHELGYHLVIIPSDTQRAAIAAMQRVLAAIARDGSSAACAAEMATFREREVIIGTAGFLERDKRYAS